MKKIFILLVLLVGSTHVFSQTRYYVISSGNDTNNGTSWATAFKTIQKALSTITAGEIWVAAATYYPDEGGGKSNNDQTAAFSLRKGVALYGGFAGTETQTIQRNWKTHETILSGDIDKDGSYSNNSNHVVYSNADDSTAILDGFTITMGDDQRIFHGQGGALRCDQSSPLIQNCYFTRNHAYHDGGAVYNNESRPTFINCRFITNTAKVDHTYMGTGGAIYNNSSSIKLINCVFKDNHAAFGTAISNRSSSPVIYNCTFYGNDANGFKDYQDCAIENDNSHPTLTNCILWANDYGEIRNSSNSSCNVTYSIVRGGYGGTGNLNVDPMFVSEIDLHLKGCSPAINKGTASGAPSYDLDGSPRPAFGGYDIGAYEFQPGSNSDVVYVKSNATGTKTGSSWANAYTKLQDALARVTTCYGPTQIWVAAGTYYPDEGTGLLDNNPNLSFALKNNVALYGGFNGTEIILGQRDWVNNISLLSGDIDQLAGNTNNSLHVVTSTSVNNSAILDGFTISAGNAGSNNGGGIYINSASPTISHCTFSANSANDGAAVYNKVSSPTISFCRFSANSAYNGAAIFSQATTVSPNNAAPFIYGCTFLSNTATTSGGAIYNYGSAGKIVSCSFWGNTAPVGSAIYNFYTNGLQLINNTLAVNTATGSGGAIYNANYANSGNYMPAIINSILWGNTGGQISYNAATVSYSIVQGGYAGATSLDPLFRNIATGDLRLQQGSPAIDKGNTAAVSGFSKDANEAGRVFGDTVDLGAYEWQQAAGPGDDVSFPLQVQCYGGDQVIQIEPGICGYDLDPFYKYSVTGGVKPVTITITPALYSILPLGEHTITISATDSTGESQSCSYMVKVVDTIPPVISCDGSTLQRSAGENCTYIINGNELDIDVSDNCSIPVVKYFQLTGATTSDEQWFETLNGVALNTGETTIHYYAYDADDNMDSCSRRVNVVDNSAPQILDLTLDKPVLYPPNHQMQDIKVSYYAHDNCPGMVTGLTVSSNETSSIKGAGNTSTDWQVIDDHHVKLRSERSGTGNDRVYTITLTATDAAGHTATATAIVTVPHDKAELTKKARVAGNELASLQVAAAPNPFTHGFILSVQTASSQSLVIRVSDALGRLVEHRKSVSPGKPLYLGESYNDGVYYVQVSQGTEVRTVKLIKQAD